MTADTSLLHFMLDAGFVVKMVLLILILASVSSWVLIFQRFTLYRQVKKKTKEFEKLFWSGIDLNDVYHNTIANGQNISGAQKIFKGGFSEFKKMMKSKHIKNSVVLENVERSMNVATSREIDSLQENLGMLATIGSVSPYIGLFGTVWGIMSSFTALGSVEQATIAMVAPGISEALIATAVGLFAAIPAVIAYNRLSNKLESVQSSYHNFIDDMLSILQRQLHSAKPELEEN